MSAPSTTRDDAVRILHLRLNSCMVAMRHWLSSGTSTTDQERQRVLQETEPFRFNYDDDAPFLSKKLLASAARIRDTINYVLADTTTFLPHELEEDEHERRNYHRLRTRHRESVMKGEVATAVQDFRDLLRKQIRPSYLARTASWVRDHIIATLFVTIVGGIAIFLIIDILKKKVQ